MTEPVDLGRLREFSDGTEAGLTGLIRIFLEDSRESLAQLIEAWNGGDRGSTTLVAHRFGGSCGACGAATLAARLFELEHCAASADRAETGRLVDDIRSAHEDATAFLSAYLERLTAP